MRHGRPGTARLPRLPRLPPLLGGWPRRAAAALCFALALLTSLAPGSTRPRRPDLAVPAGTVATSAAVYAEAASFVRPGDRIDLIETADPTTGEQSDAPVVVARGVQVLAVHPSTDVGTAQRTAQLLVAAPPDVAVAIAAHQGDRVLAAIGVPP